MHDDRYGRVRMEWWSVLQKPCDAMASRYPGTGWGLLTSFPGIFYRAEFMLLILVLGISC